MTDDEIMVVYYKEWDDSDHSAEKRAAVVADVRRCWRARLPDSRRRAFDDWGDPERTVRFWMKMKRRKHA